MPRLLKLNMLALMTMSFLTLIAPNVLFAANTVRLDCPVSKPTVDGDSVAIRVYVTNDNPLGAFSLGFKHNSADVEFSSVQSGPGLVTGGFGNLYTTLSAANNTVLLGWVNFTPLTPMPAHTTEVLMLTIWMRVPLGTPAQCVNIDSSFVPPAGYWLFSEQAGSSVSPNYVDGGSADVNIMGGCSAPVNTAPVVSDIPDQTISEGSLFATINLDNYVTDAESADDAIVWTTTSAAPNGFSVAINASRVATITHPGGEFSGSATFTFRATDPGALFNTNDASFTVTAVNDPPVVTDIPDQTLPYGGTFATINLDNYVSDADHADDQMVWTYTGNSQLTVVINASRVATISKPSADWSGSETITFRATDPGALFSENAATFTIQAAAPLIVLNDDSLFFNGYENGPNPAGQMIIITNGGNGTLNWVAGESETWMSLTAASGSAPGNTTVNIDITNLTIGRHTSAVSISAAGAGNSPQSVVIVVDIIDDVNILLSPDHLVFHAMVGTNPPSQSVNITNSSPSGIQFDWAAIETTPWLMVNPTSGTTPSNVEFSVDISQLSIGSYRAMVVIKQTSGLAATIYDDEDTVTIDLVVDTPTDVDDLGGPLPTSFSLAQNYPNPFNPTTSIEFNLPKASFVRLSVFNILGQKVKDLIDNSLSAGNKQIGWDGTDQNGRTVESGVYFYKLSTSEFTETRKMMLLK